MKKQSEKVRQNLIALIGNLVAAILFTITFASETGVEHRQAWYLICGLLLSWAPVVIGSIAVKINAETTLVKHLIAIGFACIYTYTIFLTKNSASYAFVFPMILIVCVFNDLKYMLKIVFGVVLENLITCIAALITKKAFGFVTVANSSIQIMAVLAMALASIIVMQALELSAKERVEEMETEKAHTEKALHNVTTMTESMSRTIDVINDATTKLTESTATTQDAMHEVADGASETADALQKQMEESEIIQSKIEGISQEALAVRDSMDATVTVLESGKENMDQLVAKVDDSVQLGADVTQKLETLDEYIEKMHSIVKIIGEITSQTSLLALNASIEAARAGEAGKGFAVVAGEITNMATQTQDATTNITELIDGVSSAISEVVTTVRHMISGINDQKDAATSTVESFGHIEKNTLSIQDNVQTLQSGMEELETANREIADYIQKISAISQELTARSQETLAAGQLNAEHISHISDMVDELSNVSLDE